MSAKACGNFDSLHALARYASEDLDDVLARLSEAESIYLIAPAASIGACRTAAECLMRRFANHHQTHDARDDSASFRVRFEALAEACATNRNNSGAQAWRRFWNLYRAWSSVVHGDAIADDRHALEALKCFHATLVLLLGGYCAGVTVPDFQDPLGVHGVIRERDRSIAALRGEVQQLNKTLDKADRDVTLLRDRTARAETEQEGLNKQLVDLRARQEQSVPTEALQYEIVEVQERLRAAAVEFAQGQSGQQRAEEARDEAARQLRDRTEMFERSEAAREVELRKLQNALAIADGEVKRSKGREAALQEQVALHRGNLENTQSDLAAALTRANALEQHRNAGDHSEALREMLETSEVNVKALAASERKLIAEQAARDAELLAAREQSTNLMRSIGTLKADLLRLQKETKALTVELTRLGAYRREYPTNPEAVPQFLRNLLLGQPSTPPFEGITDAIALCGDPYCDRFLASFQLQPCTVRIWTDRSQISNEERLEGWRIEASNLLRLGRLNPRPGLAHLLDAADPERPGFSIFSRPDGWLLEEFGQGARRVGLVEATGVASSLLEEMKVRDDAGLVASWPDATSVAIQQRSVVLLDPVACHFGDMGPNSYLNLCARSVKYLDPAEYAAGQAFVIAHAFVRVTGLLRPGAAPESIAMGRWLVHQMHELRRQESEQVDVGALTTAAARIGAALSADWTSRPTLRELRDGLMGLL